MFSNLNNFNLFAWIWLILLLIFLILVISWKIPETKNLTRNYTLRYSKELKFLPLILSFIFMILAWWEPRWFWYETLKTEKKWNIIFAVDVTRSMDAMDYSSWGLNISRLDYTKNFIKELIKNNSDFNYWIVAFAWESKKISPISSDKDLISTFIWGLSRLSVQSEWLSYNSTVKISGEMFWWEPWTLVIFTDWWDEEYDLSSFENLENLGIKLIVIWVWWEKPVPIPVAINYFWEYEYKTYWWEIIKTKLNNTTLERIWKYWTSYILEDKNFEKIYKELNVDIKKQLYKENLKNKKDLSIYFIFISFFFFVTYFMIFSFEKRKK